MSEEIDKSPFTLVSFTEGNSPIGVNVTRPANQFVHIDARVHQWTARRVGKTTYRLSVGGYPYVGAENGKVIASSYPQYEKLWKITHHEFQNAYTIELADKPGFGWTIPLGTEQGNEIVIGIIIALGIYPPRIAPGQLFLLKHSYDLDEE